MQNHPGGESGHRELTGPEHRVSTRRTDTQHETREQPIERIRAINNAVGKPDPRDGIPALGFTEYWYPLIAVGRVPTRKPVLVKLLGHELCVFRGKQGIAAIENHCTHRGAALSQGRCFYEGTVSCPYHGWTYDEHGTCVAVLSEGPDVRCARAQRRSSRTRSASSRTSCSSGWARASRATPPST